MIEPPGRSGGFFYSFIQNLGNSYKKNDFKVLVLTIFSYLCLPKKWGTILLPKFFENQFFIVTPK